MLKDQLGDWLEWQRRNHKQWLRIFIAILALLVVVNIFVHPPIGGGDGGGHGEAVEGHGDAAPAHGEAVDEHGAAPEHGEPMAAEGHGEPEGHGEAAEAGHEQQELWLGEAETPHGEEYDFWAVDPSHFVIDAYPGFWAAFGLGVAIVMTIVLKKFVFLLIGKPEDYYERNERY